MSVPSDAELFRTIFHTTSQCMWVVEPDGTLRDVNQAALAGSGVTAAAVVGRPFWDGPWWTMLPATQARLRSAIARAAEGGPVQTEVVVGGEVEQVLTLDCSIKPIRDAAGTVPLLLVEGRDITAAKQAEREQDHSVDRVQQVEAALRAYEQPLALATSAAESGVFEWNLVDDIVIWENERMYTIFGHSHADGPLSRQEFVAHYLHSDDLTAFEHDLAEGMQPGNQFHTVCRIWRRSDGALRWLTLDGRFDRTADGTPTRLIGVITDITVCKAAAEALRMSEGQQARQHQFLETLLDTAQVHIAVMQGHALRYTLVNRAYQSLRPEVPMLGRTYGEVFPEAAAAGAEELLRTILTTGEPHTDYGYPAPIPGKPDAAWDHQIVRLPLVAGEEPSVLVLTWDVTEHLRVQAALRTSEALYRALAANLPNGAAFVVDHDLRYRLASGQALATIGMTSADFEGKLLDEVVPPALAQSYIPHYRQALAGTPFQVEHSSHGRQYISRGVPLTDEAGQVYAALTVSYDITERLEAETALRERERQQWELVTALEAERSRLAAVLAHLPVGVWIADHAGRLIGKNEQADRIWAGDVPLVEEIAAYQEYHTWDPDTGIPLAPDEYPVARALRTGQPVAPVEVAIRRFDGTEGTVLISAAPITDQQGLVTGAVGINVDITERKQAEVALNVAKEAAEAANQMKSLFLANMSHEIRTPLTAMIGYASLLARTLSGKEQQQVQRIEESGKRLLETLNAVLMLAKLEAGRVDVKVDAVPVARDVAEIVALYRPQAVTRGLRLTLHILPPAAQARAHLDRGALTSILQNLLSNAIKFTPRGGSITVTVTQDATPPALADAPTAPDGRVYVHVADTGIGIAPEFLPHLFDPFRQESTGLSRAYGGTGLGLAITRQLVEKMDGTIDVVSVKDEGSRFTVSFPQVLQAEPLPSLEPARGVTDTFPACHMLLVEDTEDARALITAVSEERCRVTAVSSMPEAQAAIQALLDTLGQTFDAVLIDINLGGGPSGLDLLAALRTHPAYRTVPMAAVTAYALPGDRERFLAAGFDAYLSKPFTADDLLAVLAQLLPG